MNPGSAGRRAAQGLALSAAAVLALAAWLFLPRAAAAERERAGLAAVLVDVSASVARDPAWLPWVRAELRAAALAARAEGEEWAVVACAEGAATAFAPGSPGAFLERLEGRGSTPFDPGAGLATGATELSAGLATLEPLLFERPRASLLLLGPLEYTGASPAGALARLRARGVSVRARTPPAPGASELALRELWLAPRTEVGSELHALARFHLERGTRPPGAAEVHIEVEGVDGLRTLTRALPLPAGAGEFEVALACGPASAGLNRVSVRCALASGADLMPENDRARARSLASGARVLGVVVRAELEPAARAWLAPAGRSALTGLQFLFLRPEELPAHLDDLAAVISFDLPPDALPAALLEAYLLRGGGWLALSGFRFLHGWIPGESDEGLARLLPCEPAQGEAPPRDVVLLIDGSGSMSGEPFESVRAAALELVSAALPLDRVSLRFFTVALEREHVLKERSASRAADQEAARRAASELLALRVPDGMTFLLRSLQELGRQAGEHETLALLLTDGWERDALPDELGLAREVAAELRAAGVRLVVIAVGQSNPLLLGALAGGEERVQAGRSLEALRAIFHRELLGAQLAAGETPVARAPHGADSLAAEIEGASSGALAPLELYVRNRLRASAESLWESPEGEPILAVARVGSGRTALFASRPGEGWASRYARVGLGEPAEFEGLLRWLARGPAQSDQPRAVLEGEWLRLTGLPAGFPAELPVRLEDLEGGGLEAATTELLLAPPTGFPDPLGTREGRVARRPAAPLLHVPAPLEGAPGFVLPVERLLPDEFARRERRVPAEWLAPLAGTPPLAARGGGRSHPRAAATLALGLGLLLAAGLARAYGRG